MSTKDFGLLLIWIGTIIFFGWWLYEIIWSSEFPFLLKVSIMTGAVGAGLVLVNMVIEGRCED